jgi:hypothetical protein
MDIAMISKSVSLSPRPVKLNSRRLDKNLSLLKTVASFAADVRERSNETRLGKWHSASARPVVVAFVQPEASSNRSPNTGYVCG